MEKLPIHPYNPLGFDPEREKWDDANHPCMDTNVTLGWIFWVTADAFKFVPPALASMCFGCMTHLRQLMITGIAKHGLPISKVPGLECEFIVEVAKSSDLLGILFSRVHESDDSLDAEYRHILSVSSLKKETVFSAVRLNRELRLPTIPVSPFGPTDIVRPPSVPRWRQTLYPGGLNPEDPLATSASYRTVSLSDDYSDNYKLARSYLDDCTSVIQIQWVMGKVAPLSMSDGEYNWFIHLAAAKTLRIVKSAAAASPK